MKFRPHVLRDVFVLSLPGVAVLGFVLLAAFANFWRAEVTFFHGYPVRALRAGGLHAALLEALDPLRSGLGRRYLPDAARNAQRQRGGGARVFDLRIGGLELDRLYRNLPGSTKEWVKGELWEDGKPIAVDVRNRGQRMDNWYWPQKSWKIETPRSALVAGTRDLNLTPLHDRLDAHLSFTAASRTGVAAPRSEVVQLFLNLADQDLYVLEEQIDESMIRRLGRLPGDVFYGELFVPDEPARSADDLFWNPFLWRKESIADPTDAEQRAHLTALLDAIAATDLGSFDRLYELMDQDALVGWFALLTFQGDQHVDNHHNHKLYWSPVRGTFAPLLWNPLINMPAGRGVESMANRLFAKLCTDPRFLDRVHARVAEMLAQDLTRVQLEEIARIDSEYSLLAVDLRAFDSALTDVARRVERRGRTVREFESVAGVRWTAGDRGDRMALDVHAASAASLRLVAVRLAGSAAEVALWEDRDFDGTVSAADRRVATNAEGDRLLVQDRELLPVGRDLSASYRVDTGESGDSFVAYREYARLAWLRTSFLLTAPGTRGPAIAGVEAERTVGTGKVDVAGGPPRGLIATESVHPWRMPAPAPPRHHAFSGKVALDHDLHVRAVDTLAIAPGTAFALGPGVSIVVESRIALRDCTFFRGDDARPWGVFALQGPGASDSTFDGCTWEGGSEDTVRFVHYTGMVSVHGADRVVFRDAQLTGNARGDDALRFAECKDLLVQRVHVGNANGDAIDCDLATGRIENARIDAPRADGIELTASDVILDDVEVTGAGDRGLVFGERSRATVTRGRLTQCVVGLGIADASDPRIEDLDIARCHVGIAGWQENWRFTTGGRGRLLACRLADNDVDVRLDADSELVLVACETAGKRELAAQDLLLDLTRGAAQGRAVRDPRIKDLLELERR